ncbi:hypothetical protein [Roseibium sp. RKSG952]|uniref:hypothetical protein n=1 Tax=Roseibium sp. RKSG952 TaxID=2529384 RepID=UPI0012BB7BF0|nr:hypothetical protein [Roseibium sp. RKSG952]MTH99990.1 hypothetical protein [Roseibium sp. RKSG952]
MKKRSIAGAILAALLAQEVAAGQSDGLSIQLNKAETVGDACRVTLVVQNGIGAPVEALGLDLVLFDQSQTVSSYAAVDIGALPAGKTRVRQYDVAKDGCGNVSRVLVNDVRACEISGAQSPKCAEALTLQSAIEIDLIF